jgi:predicted acylesterase/phospholipase RssA
VATVYNQWISVVLVFLFVAAYFATRGGGSLGAFGCGVFKALANNNIKIDIVAGTSIGGLNATIIAGME